MNARTTESLLVRRALAEKATPGPWESDYRGMCIFTSVPKVIMIAEMRGRNDGLRAGQGQFNALHIAANSPDVVMADIDEILRLWEEVKRLKKEADWLALVLANAGYGVPLTWYIEKDVNGMSPPDPEHWREAARKAVEENHD